MSLTSTGGLWLRVGVLGGHGYGGGHDEVTAQQRIFLKVLKICFGDFAWISGGNIRPNKVPELLRSQYTSFFCTGEDLRDQGSIKAGP
jgi:hypothetical protein